MKALFIVKGPLIWLDEDGNTTGYFDVHDYVEMCRRHYDEVGIGAGYVDSLLR
jgi:2,4'-dihydroxyacetophenone dioxygenase